MVWVPGYGRYFSHCHAASDFRAADLLGLDLPHYGRSYVEEGYDEDGNELDNVPPPPAQGDMWVQYYFQVYQDALARCQALGYRKVVFMCNSTAGLTFQCWLHHLKRSSAQEWPSGVIFTAPFWQPVSPLLKNMPYLFLRSLTVLFPRLILFVDPVVTKKGDGWLDQKFLACLNSGRDTVKYDPYYNPTNNGPYYVEWFAMVIQAQSHLRTLCSEGEQLPCEALLLTADAQSDDAHVDLDAVHDMFETFYPNGRGERVSGVNHEIMLSEAEPYNEAMGLVNHFIQGLS